MKLFREKEDTSLRVFNDFDEAKRAKKKPFTKKDLNEALELGRKIRKEVEKYESEHPGESFFGEYRY